MICKRCGKDVVGSNKCLYCGKDLKPFADQKVGEVNKLIRLLRLVAEQDHAQNSSQTCTDKGININNSNSNTASTGTSDQNYSTTKKKNGILAVIGPFVLLSSMISLVLPLVGMFFPDSEWVDYIPHLMLLLILPFFVLAICAIVSAGSFGKKIISKADDKIATYPNLVPNSKLVKYYMKNKKVKLAGICFANSFMFKSAENKNTLECEGYICKYLNIHSNSIQLSPDINMKSSLNKAKNFISLDDLKISQISTYEEMYALIGAIVIFTKCYCEYYKLCVKTEDFSCEDKIEFIISVTRHK